LKKSKTLESPERLRYLMNEQGRKVLQMLRERAKKNQGVKNWEFMEAGIPRYSARIRELRQQGHIIKTVNKGGGEYEFFYIDFDPSQAKKVDECSLYLIKDGQTRFRKSFSGFASEIGMEVDLPNEGFDTLLFIENRDHAPKNPVLVVFYIKRGVPSIEIMRDTSETRKMIQSMAEKAKEEGYSFIAVRRMPEAEVRALPL